MSCQDSSCLLIAFLDLVIAMPGGPRGIGKLEVTVSANNQVTMTAQQIYPTGRGGTIL